MKFLQKNVFGVLKVYLKNVVDPSIVMIDFKEKYGFGTFCYFEKEMI